MQENEPQDGGGPTRDGPQHEGPDQPRVSARPLRASSIATRPLPDMTASGAAAAGPEAS